MIFGEKERIRIVEACGGIGAFTEALKKNKILFEIVEYIEKDQHAVDSFNAMNNTEFVAQDVRICNKNIDDIDIFMHGTPCTSVSTGGKQEGADEGSGTASSILWDDVRIISKVKPKCVIWENVANFTSNRHRPNFDKYLKKMEELNYNNYYQVLNAKDYGIPQSRNRIFTISIRRDMDRGFKFPRRQILDKTLYDLLDNEYDVQQVVLTEKELKMVKDFGAPYNFRWFCC